MSIEEVKKILNDMLTAEEALLEATLKLQMELCYGGDSESAPKHMKEEPSTTSEPTEAEHETKTEVSKTYTLEEVRAILAEKSTHGFKDEIRAILNAHGSAKLSTLSPSEYEAVVKEVEALGNA